MVMSVSSALSTARTASGCSVRRRKVCEERVCYAHTTTTATATGSAATAATTAAATTTITTTAAAAAGNCAEFTWQRSQGGVRAAVVCECRHAEQDHLIYFVSF